MAEERLSILEQRRIEAAVIKPIYDEMKAVSYTHLTLPTTPYV